MSATGREIVEQAEQRLAPLLEASNVAWWDSQVEASEENAATAGDARSSRGRTRSPTASMFAAVDVRARDRRERRRRPAPRPPPRRDARDIRCRTGSASGSSSSSRRSTCASRVTAALVGGGEVGRHRDQGDPSPERRPAASAERRGRRRRPSVPRSPTTCASSRGCATRRRGRSAIATGSRSRSRPTSSTRASWSTRSPRPTARRPSLSPAGKALLDERLAARFGCTVAELRPVALRRPVLPGGAARRRGRPRPVLRRSGRRRPGAADDRGRRPRGRSASSRAATSTPATGRTSTRSASTSTVGGDVRVLANTVPTHESADTMLHELGHGVYDLGFRDDLPWLLRSTHLVATEASAILFGALGVAARVARARPRR